MRITKSPVIAQQPVVVIRVVIIVPGLEHSSHIWIAFNIADLHAVQLFVIFCSSSNSRCLYVANADTFRQFILVV